MQVQFKPYINNNNIYNKANGRTQSKPATANTGFASIDLSANYNIGFKGLFGSKKTNKSDNGIKLSANDEILSLRLANTMHRLNEKSMIVIGNPNSCFFEGQIKRALTSENSFIPNPGKLEKIYLIRNDNSDPFLIAKKSDKEFYIHGDAKNLMNSQERGYDFYPINHDPAKMGDIIELESKHRIRLDKLDRESNDILFDKVYHAEEFYDGYEDKAKENKTLMDRRDILAPQKADVNIDGIPFRTFDNVAGMDDTIERMKQDVLFPMLYPDAFPYNINKGTILYGEPGTGKTLLVLATIGEAKQRANKEINLVEIDAAGTTRSLVGQSEEVWRNAFDDAVKKQPSILFIDELDSVVANRDKDENSKNYNTIVTQILKKMSDLEKNQSQVWVIGATNRLDAIDSAIKRSGRFGNHIEVKRPDKQGCKDIFDLYTQELNIDSEMDQDAFAQMLYDKHQTGADIAAMVENARKKMYTRNGIYEKMDIGTFKYTDLIGLKYTEEDFVPIDKEDKNNKKIKGFGN